MKKLVKTEKLDKEDLKLQDARLYMSFLRRLLRNKKQVSTIVFLMFLNSIIYVCVPFLLKEGVQRLYLLQSFHYILIWAIALILAGVIIGLLTEKTVINFSYNFTNQIKKDFYRGILKKPLDKFRRIGEGKILAFISYNIGLIKSLVSEWGTVAVQQTLNFLALFIASFFVDIRLAILFFLMIPIFIIYIFVVQYIVKKYALQLMTLNKYIYQNALETFSDFENVKIMNQEEAKFNSFSKLLDKDNHTRIQRILIYQYNKIILHGISLLLIIIFIAIGGKYLSQQQMTFSEFIFFVLYIHLLFRPFEVMIFMSSYFEAGKIGIKSVFKYLSGRDFEKVPNLNLQGSLKIENVSFKNTRDKFKLRKINLELSPGDRITIFSQNSGGKGVFIQMLLHLREFQNGQVLFDGRVLDPRAARKAIAVVSSDYMLSPGTIYSLLKGNKKLDSFDEKLIIMCQELGLMDKIISLDSKKYQGKVNKNDARFSSTEKLKLLLVKAAYQNSSIILLDNFWHQFDEETKATVQAFLAKHAAQKTIIQFSSNERVLLKTENNFSLKEGKLIKYNFSI